MPFINRLIASQMRTLPRLPHVDLTDRVFIITGANSGIGLEIARHLAQRHASKLIFAVRNIKSGAEAREVIFSECHNDASLDIEVWQVDMSSVASVKAFADRCATLDRIDGVALNAGVMGGGDMAKTVDGNEEVIQVNVISPVFLSILLAPLLRRSRPLASGNLFSPKIIFTGSAVAEVSPIKWFDIDQPLAGLNDINRYKSGDRYNESKLVLHSQVRILLKALPDIVIVDVAPGLVNSPFFRHSSGMYKFMVSRIGRTAEEGARNVSMALLIQEKSVDWYNDCKPSKLHAAWLDSPDGVKFAQNLWGEICGELEKSAPGSVNKALVTGV